MLINVWVGVESWPEDGDVVMGVYLTEEEAKASGGERGEARGPFEIDVPRERPIENHDDVG